MYFDNKLIIDLLFDIISGIVNHWSNGVLVYPGVLTSMPQFCLGALILLFDRRVSDIVVLHHTSSYFRNGCTNDSISCVCIDRNGHTCAPIRYVYNNVSLLGMGSVVLL